MDKSNVRFPGQPIRPAASTPAPVKGRTPGKVPFDAVWQEELQKQNTLKFSAHAVQRLQDRQITLDEGDLSKINEAVSAAGKKGARSSLLFYQDLALVASVKNRTIITAMNGDDLREHVFTNIDSAVIVK
ncbi:MAG: TIGR02530 family flagellar biosynthesis protein [Bacillota bacterium]|nr:TIGR02530 family flagellar biosynthesis protein [Bacillota bacterium]MDW7683009.1 TIGR02530 family flagellar biosynthesis protein [Bacillota bacterium]